MILDLIITMLASNNDELSWMQEDEDATENTPLFGTGPSLTDFEVGTNDPETPAEDDSAEEETIISKVSKTSSKTSTTMKSKVTIEDWHDDDAPSIETPVIRSPIKNLMLHFFHCFEGATILACIGLMITQIIPIVVLKYSEVGFLQTVLRIYTSLFCVLFILVELRAPLGFLKNSFLLQAYFPRGFFYSFLGVIGMEEAYSGRVDDAMAHGLSDFHVSWAPLFMQISSWFVFVIGCLYMILGACWLQLLREDLDKKHRERVAEYKRMA